MFRISYLLGKIINLLYNIEFYYFFKGKVIFEAILRFKTLENGKKMKQKCQNKYPQMQF